MKFFDAQAAMGFVVGQTSIIEAGVNEIVYPDIQYPQLIPVDTSGNPFAKTVTYFSSDKFGEAKFLNGNSDDIPIAGTERSKFETAINDAGVGYAFGYVEVNQAMMLGVNLQADDAAAARRASEELIDRVALVGDAAIGFNGLINNPSVNAANAVHGNWPAATEDDILADINDAILAIANDTAYTSVADTLLLPHARLNLLATTRLGDTTETILSFLRRNNTFTATTGRELLIRGVRGLETAGAGGTQRMVAYRRDPGVLKLHIPMPHRFLPVHQDGPLRWVVPGLMRLGGLDIRRPLEVKYRDGI